LCEEKHAEKNGFVWRAFGLNVKKGKIWKTGFHLVEICLHTSDLEGGKKNDVPLPEMSKLAGRSGRSRFARNWFGHASTAAGRHRL